MKTRPGQEKEVDPPVLGPVVPTPGAQVDRAARADESDAVLGPVVPGTQPRRDPKLALAPVEDVEPLRFTSATGGRVGRVLVSA